MLVFLAYCACTVWLGEWIPDTGTYANAYANQLKDRFDQEVHERFAADVVRG